MGEETKTAVRAVETGERKDRVLIVEDEDNARKGYEQLLQKWVHVGDAACVHIQNQNAVARRFK